MSAGGTVAIVPFIRSFLDKGGWTEVTQTSAAKARNIPPEVTPEAFIRWGGPTEFTEASIREDLKNPIPPESEPPLAAQYYEEARTWEDFEVVEPEEGKYKVVARKTSAIAFRGTRKISPLEDEEGTPIPNHDALISQIQLSFSNDYQQSGGPITRNSRGQIVEPIVLDPFTQIIEVGWPVNFYMKFDVLFEGRANVFMYLSIDELGINTVNGGDFANQIFGALWSDSVSKDNKGGREGTATDIRQPKPVVGGLGRLTQQGSGPGGMLASMEGVTQPTTVDAGNLFMIDSDMGQNSSVLMAMLPKPKPDDFPPWEWRLDIAPGTEVGMWYPGPGPSGPPTFFRLTENGVIVYDRIDVVAWDHAGSGGQGTVPWKLTVYRKWYKQHEYKYYPSFSFTSWLVDIKQLWKLLANNYYIPNKKSVTIQVYATLDATEEGVPHAGHVRWATYRGSPDDALSNPLKIIQGSRIVHDTDGGGEGG